MTALLLEALSERLDTAPQSLGALMTLLSDAEGMEEFLELIREYLPEREAEITGAGNIEDQIAAFYDFFNQRYFPLADDAFEMLGQESDGDMLSNFCAYMPVELFGFRETEDGPFDRQPGWQLMLALIKEAEQGESHAVRIEAAAGIVGKRVARRIPAEGWEVEELRAMTANSRYTALGDFASWEHAETGLTQMDCHWSDGCDPFDWSRDNIEMLTREAVQVQAMQEGIRKLSEWLEEKGHFGEMLDFLLEKAKSLPPRPSPRKKGKTLIEVFKS